MQPVRHNTVAYIESAPSADGRNKVGCIVLGRGEDDKKVQWRGLHDSQSGSDCDA